MFIVNLVMKFDWPDVDGKQTEEKQTSSPIKDEKDVFNFNQLIDHSDCVIIEWIVISFAQKLMNLCLPDTRLMNQWQVEKVANMKCNQTRDSYSAAHLSILMMMKLWREKNILNLSPFSMCLYMIMSSSCVHPIASQISCQ